MSKNLEANIKATANKSLVDSLVTQTKDEPTIVIPYFLVTMGRIVIEMGGNDCIVKTEATIEEVRYSIEAKIKVKRIKK